MARRAGLGLGLGLGPVFAFEWRMAARRWQTYALRSLTVLLLLGAMAPFWFAGPAAGETSFARQAQLGQVFHQWTAMILLGLVGLAAPAATAGAICQDRARGNLALLLTTDLSSAEIVLGKLAARLAPVLGMLLGVAPVLAITTLFGGVDPVGLLGVLLVLLSCAIFGSSLALTLSIWGRRMHEVLLATYVVGLLYLLATPIASVLQGAFPASPWRPSFVAVLRYNPIFLALAAFAGQTPPGGPVTLGTQARFLGVGLAASALLLGAATWRLRASATRPLDHRGGRATWSPLRAGLDRLGRWAPGAVRLGRRARRAWPGPSLDRNPVLWREFRRTRLSGWSLAAWGAYALLGGGFSLYAIAAMLGGHPWGGELGAVVNALQVGAGLLLLSASAATSLAEERQRGDLDVLLATPLPTRAIVWGKWWGASRALPPLLVLPTLVTAALSARAGQPWAAPLPLLAALVLSYGAALNSLGLALATWTPRPGRAAALTVGLYASMSIGWFPLCMIVLGEKAIDAAPGIAAGSPLAGVGIYSMMLAEGGRPHEFASLGLWTLFWATAYGAAALALLLATLATFNRCLGRVDAPTLRDGEPAAPAAPADLSVPGP